MTGLRRRLRVMIDTVLENRMECLVDTVTKANVYLCDVPRLTEGLSTAYTLRTWVDALYVRKSRFHNQIVVSLCDHLPELKPGAAVTAVRRFDLRDECQDFCFVELEGGGQGVLYCTDMTEPAQWTDSPFKGFTTTTQLQTTILFEREVRKKKYWVVSCRKDNTELKVNAGDLVHGFVAAASNKGICVR